MARKRMVSPDLLTSESLASLPIPTRYAFVALWMYVDDHGRGKDNPALIRAHTWPLDDDMSTEAVENQIAELEDAGSVCRYTVEGAALLHIPAWTTFQKVSHPTDSRLPVCPGEKYKKGHDEFVRASRAARERLRLEQFSSVQEGLSGSDAAAPEDGAVDVAAHAAEARQRIKAAS